MGIPLRELMQRINSRDFALYLAYMKVEPFGPLVDDMRYAGLVSLLANVNRDSKKKPTPYAMEQFMFSETEKKAKIYPPKSEVIKKIKAFAKVWQ